MVGRRVFLKQVGFSAGGAFIFPGIAFSNPPVGPSPFLRSTPEQQGISSAAIRDFLAAIHSSGQEFHSIMIIRHGCVVAEGWWYPWSPGYHQQLYSLSKSFTGTAIGIAIDEKRLKLDDPVIGFFPAEQPSSISTNLAALKVRHLL